MAQQSEQVPVELPEWVTRPLSDIQMLAENGELSDEAANLQGGAGSIRASDSRA
jgi:hypothetical protein